MHPLAVAASFLLSPALPHPAMVWFGDNDIGRQRRGASLAPAWLPMAWCCSRISSPTSPRPMAGTRRGALRLAAEVGRQSRLLPSQVTDDSIRFIFFFVPGEVYYIS